MTRRIAILVVAIASASAIAGDGNRFARLGRTDPYYVGRDFPKLVTPHWVGEPGVEAVVILAIDDMRGPEKWEAFLRPILDRLKRIDGRAPVSIMTCQVDPRHPQLQTWLKEGLSLECHTFDHPCPLLKDGNVAKAKATYDRCVDQLADVPNNRPVAFRTPCCDSLNTVSPRLFVEIFNRTTGRGRFLSLDSSVFNVFTPNDPALPRPLVLEPNGRERFGKYLPADRSFVNYVDDYPYPFVVNKLCWEFPCATPSDWQAQHLHGPNNPATVRDWQACIDATILKQGVMTMVFHPHGWIRNDQLVELVDYAERRYGKRVKFLTFKEAEERLTKNLLGGVPLRSKAAKDDGVRLIDLDGDGRDEKIVALPGRQGVFTWSGADKAWQPLPFSLPADALFVDAHGRDAGLRLVDIDGDGHPDLIWSNETSFGLYLFADMKTGWSRRVLHGKPGDPGALPLISRGGTDNGAWFHSRHLWVQNEDTALLKDHVDRRSFNDLLSTVDPPAHSPAESLHMMRPRPGFVAELVAAEPLVQDPIAFASGPDGKLWVVEMGDYPLGVDGHGKSGGRVKVLSDPDEHGRYRKAAVFLDNLSFPTGVLPWRNGVLVTCAPDVFYAEDTTGSGKADKRVTLLTGFVPGNQQHRVNGLTWGLDNWVYGANGDSGGLVKVVNSLTPGPSPAKPGEGRGISIRGHDFRFRPDTGEFELVTGQSQYGRCQDDWGNWFGGNNTNPAWHFALDAHYLRRNPHLDPPEPRVKVPVEPGLPRVYPVSRTLPRFNDLDTANRFTSACSPTVYRDDLFGPNFAGNLFVCEPVHDLVSRLIVSPAGGTFQGRRAVGEERAEFLASIDNWCRPVFARTGPDGALWVSDMYRQVIEHPQWIPADWQKRLDLRAGHELGRIYRVRPVDRLPRPIPRLDQLDPAGLVSALDSPNGWQRDLAQQMLLWKHDLAAVPALESLAASAGRPQARLQALCTLAGLGALRSEVVRLALTDAHPGVRRQAVRLAEPLLPTAPELGPMLLTLVNDADAQVRMQLAYTLGEWHAPRAGAALGDLVVRAAGDPYLTAAALSSVTRENLSGVAAAVLKHERSAGLIVELLRQADAFGAADVVTDLLAAVTKPRDGRYAAWQFAALAGLLENQDHRRVGPPAEAGKLFAAARTVAADAATAPADRGMAVRLLGRSPEHRAEDLNQLEGLMAPQVPEEVQSAAVTALARMQATDLPARLLGGWRGYGPGLRAQVLEILSRRDDWLRATLDAVERKDLPVAEVDAARRQQWLRYRNKDLRGRAERLLGGAANPDRQKIIDAYAEVLKLQGDPARGRPLFTKHCATCHRLGGTGGEVGPDLTALADKPTDYLLTAILDPNRAVEPRYVAYVAGLKNGQQITGVLTGESGNRVTLTGTDGKAQTVARSDLASLESTGRSAMPEGLEKDLRPQDLADLIAHLRKP
jgi:putative membrane-bound dehydrogenase-like protein